MPQTGHRLGLQPQLGNQTVLLHRIVHQPLLRPISQEGRLLQIVHPRLHRPASQEAQPRPCNLLPGHPVPPVHIVVEAEEVAAVIVVEVAAAAEVTVEVVAEAVVAVVVAEEDRKIRRNTLFFIVEFCKKK